MLELTRYLVSEKINVNDINVEGRTALHYAAAYGHAELAGVLIGAGGDIKMPDRYGVTPEDIIANPGPISAKDALKFCNITQRPVKRIERIIHPERDTDAASGIKGWAAGNGGWGDERLKGFEEDMDCDVDQYWADEIDADALFEKYLARGAPVLIRGLLTEWPAIEKWTHDKLVEEHGDLKVQVG
jgi:hypothetical protein